MHPTDKLYTKEHEWIQIEGDQCSLGITEYAQDELGEVVYVELPEVGQSYDKDEEIGTIESVKAVAELFTPLAGEVVEINETLVDEPERVNSDPHGGGWLVKLKLSGDASTDGLMNAEEYEAFTKGEAG